MSYSSFPTRTISSVDCKVYPISSVKNTIVMLLPAWDTVRWVLGMYVLLMKTENSSCPKLNPDGAETIVFPLKWAVCVFTFIADAIEVLFQRIYF